MVKLTEARIERIKREVCPGCHHGFYNYGGGAKMAAGGKGHCWSMERVDFRRRRKAAASACPSWARSR